LIDFLEGTIEELRDKYLLLNVNGTGYGITVTAAAAEALDGKTGTVRVYTYMSVSENGVALYGFSGQPEKEVFLALIGVEGIGPKAGVNILSGIEPEKLREAIASGNEAALTRVPGLGPKKAQRLILELKEKFRMFVVEGKADPAEDDYLQALLGLGFKYRDAMEALKEAIKAAPDREDREAVIKEAIKRLGKA